LSTDESKPLELWDYCISGLFPFKAPGESFLMRLAEDIFTADEFFEDGSDDANLSGFFEGTGETC